MKCQYGDRGNEKCSHNLRLLTSKKVFLGQAYAVPLVVM